MPEKTSVISCHDFVNEFPELLRVFDLWPLGVCSQCELLTAGRNNESYHVVTDSGDYVLRRSRANKTEEALVFEHALINHLRDNGLPAPDILPSCTGKTWEICGERLWTVSRFIVGDHLQRNEPSARLGGEIMARFHLAMAQFSSRTQVPPAENRISDVLQILAGCSQKSVPDKTFSSLIERTQHAAQYTNNLLAANTDNQKDAIIHGSCRLTSLLQRDNKVVAFLDMDSTRRGIRAEDIAIALASFAKCRDGSAAVDANMVVSFCEGYRSILALEKIEANAVPAFLAQALLFPWAKAMERSLASLPFDAEKLARTQWRLASAEHAANNPQQVINIMLTNG